MRSHILFAVAATLAAGHAVAQTTEVHVLASNGIRAVMEALHSDAEHAVGRPLSIEFNSSSALKQRIESGESFDVAILTSDVLEGLVKEGKIVKTTAAGIARSGIGVGIREGAPKPDIHNAAAMKQALLNAKSITFAEDGASKVYVDKMFERYGITEQMKPKLMPEQGSTRATARVAEGRAEMILTLASEILPVKGLELVGPLPASDQNYISMSAGVGAKAAHADYGKALIKFLTGPTVVRTLKEKGMERAH